MNRYGIMGLLLWGFFPLAALAQIPDSIAGPLTALAHRVEQFGKALPQEKVALHLDNTSYYQGDDFTAVDWSLQNRGTIWFLLPEEGTSPEELLKDSQALEFLSESSYRESVEYYLINLALPKFDITSQTDLLEGLKTLGVTDAMDWSISDFSPVTQDVEELFLSQVQHGVRVAVDEEGVEGAAYTVMQADGASAAAEPEEVDFVLDRPFVFAITSQDGLPLFVGIVNQPG